MIIIAECVGWTIKKKILPLYSIMTELAVTAKLLGNKFCHNGHYEDTIIKHWKSQDIKIRDLYYELDSKDKVHLHGVIVVPKGYYLKKLQLRGVHTYVRELDDNKGYWNMYIRKCPCTFFGPSKYFPPGDENPAPQESELKEARDSADDTSEDVTIPLPLEERRHIRLPRLQLWKIV